MQVTPEADRVPELARCLPPEAAAAVRRKAREGVVTQEAFFEAHAERIVACCSSMARAFADGGRLFVAGNGGSACDAQHVAVEFMHPILEKRQPLPATALTTDVALLTAVGNDQDFALAFSRQLAVLARPGDILLSLSTSGRSAGVLRAVKLAREHGLLTIGFTGGDGGPLAALCDHAFVVESFSTHRIQEVHTALLHVVWDLVHMALGEPDIL